MIEELIKKLEEYRNAQVRYDSSVQDITAIPETMVQYINGYKQGLQTAINEIKKYTP